MRIACPSCAAEYEVPDSRLKPGKLVRCARCSEKWLPRLPTDTQGMPNEASEPPMPHPERDIASLPEVTAMDRLAASPAPQPARGRLIAAWVLTFVVLAAAVAAAIGWRDTIVRTWPASGRLLATSNHGPTPGSQGDGSRAVPGERSQAAPGGESHATQGDGSNAAQSAGKKAE
jgi:predicted Zn finger-like uncharacterized protein